MSEMKVVNHRFQKYDVYVGRSNRNEFHFGNPFTHDTGTTLAVVKVGDRETAIACFKAWLEGDPRFLHIEPDRRLWILNRIPSLKGKVLGCWCAPLPCHGDVLLEMANKEKESEI